MKFLVKTWPMAGLVLLANCAHGTTSGVLEPTVHLTGLAVRGIGFTGGLLDANLRVENPNAFDIRGTHLEMSLDLEGIHFGPSQLDQAFSLPAKDGAAINVPVTFKWSDVGAAAKTVLGYGSAKYTLTGKVSVDVPGGSLSIPFTQQGTVTLSQLRSLP